MSENLQAIAFSPYIDSKQYEVMFSGWSKTDPEHNMGPLIRPYYLVHYVISGQGHFYAMGKHHILTAGDSFFIHPGELVQYTSDSLEPWEYCWVAFRGDRFADLLKRMRITPEMPTIHRDPSRRVRGLLHIIRRTLARREPHDILSADGYLQLLLGEYASGRMADTPQAAHPASVDSHIEHAIGLLTHRYFQPISIAELAREIGYHRTYFSKMFKERTGMSPQTFLMKIRMEQARILLASDLSVEQIAASVGFNDPLYFSKQFKRWFGIPPSRSR